MDQLGQNTELKKLEDFTVFMVARRKPANTLLWGTEKVAAHAVAVSRISGLLKSTRRSPRAGVLTLRDHLTTLAPLVSHAISQDSANRARCPAADRERGPFC